MDLKEKKALVLGASRGIGLAIARLLAREGCQLILTWHDWPEASQAMQEEFQVETGPHHAYGIDLRSPEEVRQMARWLEKTVGGLDILINNIERGGMPVVHGAYDRPVNRHQWQLELATTLEAKHLVWTACLPLLRQAPEAAVINISSMAAITGRSGPVSLLFSDGYSAANRGVGALTATWARQGAPTIRVNEIMLGLIDTRHGPGTRGWAALAPKERQRLLDHTLLGRTGTPEEVATMVRFVLREATFMTGATLRMDGGYVLGGERVTAMPPGIIE